MAFCSLPPRSKASHPRVWWGRRAKRASLPPLTRATWLWLSFLLSGVALVLPKIALWNWLADLGYDVASVYRISVACDAVWMFRFLYAKRVPGHVYAAISATAWLFVAESPEPWPFLVLASLLLACYVSSIENDLGEVGRP